MNIEEYNTIGIGSTLSISFEEKFDDNKLTELSNVMNRAGIINTGLVQSQSFYQDNEFVSGNADYQLIIEEFDSEFSKQVIESFLKRDVILNVFDFDRLPFS